jgi:hypothetical protein
MLTKRHPPELTWIEHGWRLRHADADVVEARDQVQAINLSRIIIDRAAAEIIDALGEQSLVRHDGRTRGQVVDALARQIDELVSDEVWNARAVRVARGDY